MDIQNLLVSLQRNFTAIIGTTNDSGATPLDYSFQLDHTDVTQLLQHMAASKLATNHTNKQVKKPANWHLCGQNGSYLQ